MSTSIGIKRLFSLDISRCFASLGVVLWHWQHFFHKGSFIASDFSRSSQPLYSALKIFYEKGILGVDYFFLLSGFIFFWLYKPIIEEKNLSFGSFCVQRISRLYPLHLVTLLIVALLQGIYFFYHGQHFVYFFNDLYHFFLNLAFISGWGFQKGWSFNAPVWSVSIEILLYLLFFTSVYARKSHALFYFGISVISFISTLFLYTELFNAMSLFFLGGAVFQATALISTRFRKLTGVIHMVTILSWVLTIVNFYVFNLANSVEQLFFAGEIFLSIFQHYILFPFTICSITLLEIDGKMEFIRPISWIGDITYSSYLLHFPLQLIFVLAVSYGIIRSDFYSSPIHLALFFLILIPLSYITFVKFERPMQNLIRKAYRDYKTSKQGM